MQYFGNWKFLRGFLFRTLDRSADGVFHLAILAQVDKTRQTVDCFSLVFAKDTVWYVQNDFYIDFIKEKSR